MIFVYLVALASGLFSGIGEVLNKNITEKKYSVFSYAFIQWFGAALLYAIPFFLLGKIPTNPIAYVYLGIVISIVLIGNMALIKAYKTEDISNINIISQISLVIPYIMGTVFLHETGNIYKISGIMLILTGVVIIFYENKRLHLSPAYLLALVAGLGFGVTGYFNKLTLSYMDPLSLLFLYNLTSAILLFIFPKTRNDLIPIFNKYKWKIIFSRLAIVIGLYLLIWSIKMGNISVVNVNSETALFLSTVFIGLIFLRETKNIPKKLAGTFVCTLGIILLNFF